MAVTNVWGTGHSILVPQLRSTSSPSSSSSSSCCSFDCFSKKSAGLRLFLLGKADYWGVPRKQFLKTRQSSKLSCRCSVDGAGEDYRRTSIKSSFKDWDWNRWTRHFEEIEQAESFVSVLKFQLEDAVEKEDFEEAAKLKIAIAEATSKDAVAKIMSDLKSAIDEERYHDASRLCRSTGSGLVGWWVGCSKDSDDPFGRLIRITPGVGRFVGRSYSPRQLITASPGAPLFEIFVTKDTDESYTMQVAFLRRAKVSSKISSKLSSSSSTKGTSTSAVEDASAVDIDENETKAEKSTDKNRNIEGATEEGITSVINFLKEKIPELKLKVMKVNVTEEVIKDADAVKKLIEEDEEDNSDDDSTDEETSDSEGIQPDRVVLGEGNENTEDGKNLDMKVFIGGVLHNKEDISVKDEFVRLPAEVKDIEKDSFVLHVPVKSQAQDREENVIANVKVASLAAKSVSELMPSDVAKAFMGSDKISPKVSKDVREIVKLAVSQAQKREKLSEYTTFSRITTTESDLDPFDGLYVGAFGPYGTEVVQLRRKYGNWNVNDETVKSSDVEFFEYVEAVKLTGDLNVPAGQVTFRAKLGKANRASNRGLYPDELGVVASYKGQGRIAEFGFRNPKWVDGELLQLNGKGMGPYVKGADLGFLYVVPEQSFLVLFNRLKLPQ